MHTPWCGEKQSFTPHTLGAAKSGRKDQAVFPQKDTKKKKLPVFVEVSTQCKSFFQEGELVWLILQTTFHKNLIFA